MKPIGPNDPTPIISCSSCVYEWHKHENLVLLSLILYQFLLALCLHFMSSHSIKYAISSSNLFISTTSLGLSYFCTCSRSFIFSSNSFVVSLLLLAFHLGSSSLHSFSFILILVQLLRPIPYFLQVFSISYSHFLSWIYFSLNLNILLFHLKQCLATLVLCSMGWWLDLPKVSTSTFYHFPPFFVCCLPIKPFLDKSFISFLLLHISFCPFQPRLDSPFVSKAFWKFSICLASLLLPPHFLSWVVISLKSLITHQDLPTS